MPSTVARYGASTAVSAMSNAQLGIYYGTDVTLGVANHGNGNGLKQMLADGRAFGDWQDHEDAVFIRRTLGLGNGD
jgi:hypothetical protein